MFEIESFRVKSINGGYTPNFIRTRFGFVSMPHDASLDEQQRLFAFLARVNEDAQKVRATVLRVQQMSEEDER